MAFDLVRFRDLAFSRAPLPDHPMQTEAEAKKLIELLPEDDAAHALAGLTQWTASMNATGSFTAGRRASEKSRGDAPRDGSGWRVF